MKRLLGIGAFVLVAAIVPAGCGRSDSGRTNTTQANLTPTVSVPHEAYTFAMLVKERAVIRRALREPLLRDTQWFTNLYEQDLSKLEAALLEGLDVRVLRGTALIEVAFETDRREDAPPIVNSVVKVYLAWADDLLNRDTRIHLATLRTEETKLKAAMRLRKKKLDDLSKSGLGVSLSFSANTRLNILRRRLIDLNREVTKAELDEAGVKQASKAMEQAVDEGRLELTDQETAAIEADGIVRNLEYARIQIDEQLKEMSMRFAPEHPQIKLLRTRRAEILRQQSKRREDLRTQAFENRLERIRAAHASGVKELKDKVDKAKIEKQELDERIIEYVVAEEEFRNVQELYKQVSAQRKKLEQGIASPNALSLDWAGEALPPLAKSASGKWRAATRILVTGTRKDPLNP